MAELHRRLTAAGSTATAITANTGNPVKTWVGSRGHRVAGMPAWKGALTMLYAATVDLPGNSYIGPSGFRGLSGWPTGVGRSQAACDPELAKAVWARSEDLTGVAFSW